MKIQMFSIKEMLLKLHLIAMNNYENSALLNQLYRFVF